MPIPTFMYIPLFLLVAANTTLPNTIIFFNLIFNSLWVTGYYLSITGQFLREKINFLISDLKGGNFRLAIPREAHVTVALEEKDVETLKDIVKNFESVRKEWKCIIYNEM